MAKGLVATSAEKATQLLLTKIASGEKCTPVFRLFQLGKPGDAIFKLALHLSQLKRYKSIRMVVHW